MYNFSIAANALELDMNYLLFKRRKLVVLSITTGDSGTSLYYVKIISDVNFLI